MENSPTIHVLRKLGQIEVPIIVFVIEIRLNINEVELLKRDLGMPNGIIVKCDFLDGGKKGDLCLFYD